MSEQGIKKTRHIKLVDRRLTAKTAPRKRLNPKGKLKHPWKFK